MNFSRREFTKRLSWLMASLPIGASIAGAQTAESPNLSVTTASISTVATSGSESPSSVSYRVRVLPAQHELEVEMTIEGPAAEGSVRLGLPNWVPGAYAFIQFGRDLFDLKAQDARTGAPLTLSRDGWQSFRIDNAHGAVRVSYRANAYATQFSSLCGLLDS